MPYIEDLREFADRQNCPYVRVEQRVIFENGAVWFDGSYGKQFGSEPPTDPIALDQMRSEFLTAKLSQIRQQQTQLRNAITAQAEFYGRGCGPHPDTQFLGWREQLQVIALEIEAVQAELDALKRKHSRTQLTNEYDQRRAAERQGAAEVMQTLRDLSH